MSIASTVTVASLENPEIPSVVLIPVHGCSTISVTITKIAVTSTGSSSVAKNINARTTTANTTSIFSVTLANPVCIIPACTYFHLKRLLITYVFLRN